MPERNEPCPCGSGKKYKKCCGAGRPASRQADLVAISRAVAYRGDIGRRRRAFCEEYAAVKKEGIADVEAKLKKEITGADKLITCPKGCNYCCQLYVFADLQECECIVHYLYQHEEALRNYLDNYPRWRAVIDGMGRTLARIEKAQERVLFGAASEADRRIFEEGLAAYAARQNPCPFLKDGLCSIYEVRPYVCAGVVSVSPPERCAPGRRERNESLLYKADFQPQNDLPYFMATACAINFGCMPELVHRILTHGYAFLATIEGLEGIRDIVAGDPEVRATLGMMGMGR